MIAALYSQGRLCQPIADGGMPPEVPHPVSDLALNLVSTTMDEIGVTWQDPTDGPEFDTIRLQVQPPGGDWTSIQETTVASGVQAGLVGGGALTPNTEYQVRVRTEGLSGNSEWALLGAATRPAAPTPANAAYDNVDTATYSFDGVTGSIEALTYEVESTPPLSWSAPTPTGGNSFVSTATVTDAGSYYVRARVTNDRGLVSAWTSDMLFTI